MRHVNGLWGALFSCLVARGGGVVCLSSENGLIIVYSESCSMYTHFTSTCTCVIEICFFRK